MAGIRDVAREAGVSTATVSRVLANKPHVREELRARVLEAVERLDYRPNRIAQALRSQQSHTIGLIVSDIRNPYFTAVSRAVEDAAYDDGISVFLCNADESPDKEAMYLGVMRGENVGGVIFSPTRQSARDFERLRIDFPTVVIDREVESDVVDQVLIDNVGSARELATLLVSNGYRRIAGLFGKMSTTGRQRRDGFAAALAAASLVPVAARFLPPRIEAGYAASSELLAAEDPPDAIFTSNSMLAAGALRAIRAAGLRIPDDVALVGFDDATWTTLVEPEITVIAQPTDEIGRTATELLFKRMADPERPTRKIILNGRLLARGSSRPRV